MHLTAANLVERLLKNLPRQFEDNLQPIESLYTSSTMEYYRYLSPISGRLITVEEKWKVQHLTVSRIHSMRFPREFISYCDLAFCFFFTRPDIIGCYQSDYNVIRITSWTSLEQRN